MNDPVECDLVFHQLIQDVFEERIPITPAEAVSTFVCVFVCGDVCGGGVYVGVGVVCVWVFM